MKKLYIRFKVTVSDTEYGYKGRQGSAEMAYQIPSEMLPEMDPGNLFQGLVTVALADMEAAEPPKEG